MNDQDVLALLKNMFSSKETKCHWETFDKIQEMLKNIVDKFCAPDTETVTIDGAQEIRAEIQTFQNSLRDLILFPQFANKYIVALGGNFNAGKSSVLNCIFRGGFLPVGYTPTTSIPTTIVPSANTDSNYSWGDHFGRYHSISAKDFKNITHELKNTSWGNCSLLPLISSLRCTLTNNPYKNLVFLDTPGIGSQAGEDVDKQLAHDMICRTDILIWVIPFAQGTELKKNLEFFRSAVSEFGNQQKKIFLLLNKAETSSAYDQETVVHEVKKVFNDFKIEGISVFSAKTNKTYCGKSPQLWLDELNKEKPKRTQFFLTLNNLLDAIKKVLAEKSEEMKSYYKEAASAKLKMYFFDKERFFNNFLKDLDEKRKELSDLLKKILNDLEIKDEITHPTNAYGTYFATTDETFPEGYTTIGRIVQEFPELDRTIICCHDNEGHTLELLAVKSELAEGISQFTAHWYMQKDDKSHMFRLEMNNKHIDYNQPYWSTDCISGPEKRKFGIRYFYAFCLAAIKNEKTMDADLQKFADYLHIPLKEIQYLYEQKLELKNMFYYFQKLKETNLLPYFYAYLVRFTDHSKTKDYIDGIRQMEGHSNFYSKDKGIYSYLTEARFEFREKSLCDENFLPIWDKCMKIIDFSQINELVSLPAANPEGEKKMFKISKEIRWDVIERKNISYHSFLFRNDGKISIKGTGSESLIFDQCNFFFYGESKNENDFLIYAEKCRIQFINCRFFGNEQRGIIKLSSVTGGFENVIFQKMKTSGYCIENGEDVSFTRCSFEECAGKYIVKKGKFTESGFLNCEAKKQLVDKLYDKSHPLYIKNCKVKDENINADETYPFVKNRYEILRDALSKNKYDFYDGYQYQDHLPQKTFTVKGDI